MVKFVTRRYISEYLHYENSRYEHEMEFSDGNRHSFEILDLSSQRTGKRSLNFNFPPSDYPRQKSEQKVSRSKCKVSNESESDDDQAQSDFEDHLRWGDVFFLMFSIRVHSSLLTFFRTTIYVVRQNSKL